MSTYLVTGASGYLGSHIVGHLLQAGHHIIAPTPNLQDVPAAHPHITVCPLDQMSVHDIFRQHHIDGIFHFATCYGRNGQNAAQVAQVNVLFPLQLLSFAVEYKVRFFINTDTILQAQINPYALSKYQFSQWLDFYSGQIKAINMRLDHFYGPHDHPVKFIAWLIEQFKANVPSIDLTEGAQMRDFIFIDDVVSAYLCVFEALDRLPAGKMHTFELGSGTKTSIKDMVLLLQRLMHKEHVKLNFGAIAYRKHERLDYNVDISALQALGWRAQFSLQKGLEIIIKEEHL